MRGDGRLSLVQGEAVVADGAVPEPLLYQAQLVDAYVASQVARGFSEVTIENGTGTLERFLERLACPVWEATRDDVDRVIGELATQGLGATTRRGYVQAFKGFHHFVTARRAPEIEAFFGVRLEDPFDEFNTGRHVALDSPSALPPPSHERMESFFQFLRERIASARKFATAARDYALFRSLYHAGLRADETASLETRDLSFHPRTVRQDPRALRQGR